jgi:hypothetical protein
MRSHYENNCTQYENKKLHHSHPLKLSLLPGGGETRIRWIEWKTGAIFIAEGHFNLEPVLRLDVQEFNPEAGCLKLHSTMATTKRSSCPMERRATESRAIIRPICPRAASGNREDAFLQSVAQGNPGKMSGANPSSFTRRDRWTLRRRFYR